MPCCTYTSKSCLCPPTTINALIKGSLVPEICTPAKVHKQNHPKIPISVLQEKQIADNNVSSGDRVACKADLRGKHVDSTTPLKKESKVGREKKNERETGESSACALQTQGERTLVLTPRPVRVHILSVRVHIFCLKSVLIPKGPGMARAAHARC